MCVRGGVINVFVIWVFSYRIVLERIVSFPLICKRKSSCSYVGTEYATVLFI